MAYHDIAQFLSNRANLDSPRISGLADQNKENQSDSLRGLFAEEFSNKLDPYKTDKSIYSLNQTEKDHPFDKPDSMDEKKPFFEKESRPDNQFDKKKDLENDFEKKTDQNTIDRLLEDKKKASEKDFETKLEKKSLEKDKALQELDKIQENTKQDNHSLKQKNDALSTSQENSIKENDKDNQINANPLDKLNKSKLDLIDDNSITLDDIAQLLNLLKQILNNIGQKAHLSHANDKGDHSNQKKLFSQFSELSKKLGVGESASNPITDKLTANLLDKIKKVLDQNPGATLQDKIKQLTEAISDLELLKNKKQKQLDIKQDFHNRAYKATTSNNIKNNIHQNQIHAPSQTSSASQFQNASSLKSGFGKEGSGEGSGNELTKQNGFIPRDSSFQKLFSNHQVKNIYEAQTSQLEQRQLIQRIVQNVKHAAVGNKEIVTVKLYPESLGKVAVTINKEDSIFSAKLVVEHYAVKELIESKMQDLKDHLNQSGLSFEQVDVELKQNSNGNRENDPAILQAQNQNNAISTVDDENDHFQTRHNPNGLLDLIA